MVDTVVVNAPKGESSPEHDQQMIDVVDQANADAGNAAKGNEASPIENTQDRPQWLPEKFKSAEDLAKAYAELESKLGKKPAEVAPEVAPEVKAEAAAAPEAEQSTEQVREELQSKGLDLNDFSNEFNQSGQLSEDSYKKLEAGGYPRSVVDQYIAGQQAIAANFESEIKGVAGGAESFKGMVEWARVNADPKEVAAYNRAIDSGDQDQAKLAVAGMYQKFLAARPDEGRLVTSTTGTKAGGELYESVEDYVKDAANPEYKSNPAFRNKVIAKLGRSNIL